MFFIFSDCISTRIKQFSPKSPKSENVLSLIRMSWEEKCLKIIIMSWTAIRATRVAATAGMLETVEATLEAMAVKQTSIEI